MECVAISFGTRAPLACPALKQETNKTGRAGLRSDLLVGVPVQACQPGRLPSSLPVERAAEGHARFISHAKARLGARWMRGRPVIRERGWLAVASPVPVQTWQGCAQVVRSMVCLFV